MYAAVPRMTPTWVMAGLMIVGDIVSAPALSGPPAPGSASLARPKSSTFTVPSGRTLMLAGLRSRWMMPCSCAASSASTICRAIGSASSSGSGPSRDAVGQRRPLDELHHERARAATLFEAVDLRDVRVIERGQELGFALETREPVRVAREAIRAGS